MQGNQENGAIGQGAAASSHDVGGSSTQTEVIISQTTSASAQNTVADLGANEGQANQGHGTIQASIGAMIQDHMANSDLTSPQPALGSVGIGVANSPPPATAGPQGGVVAIAGLASQESLGTSAHNASRGHIGNVLSSA